MVYMFPNGVSLAPGLPSLPSLPTPGSLGSLASLGSIGSFGSLGSISLSLACVASSVSASALPLDAADPIRVAREEGDGDGDESPEREDAVAASDSDESGQAGGQGGARAQVITACSVPGTAALTFDDGPYTFTEEVSRVLKENGATGTFFFNGCINSPENAARVKAAFDAGHQVASHTWSHKDLATLSKEEIVNEMSSVSQAIQKITGVTPAQMRPPFGSYNDLVVEAAGQLGQDVVNWNVDSGDSAGASPDQSQAKYEEAVQQKLPILALNHETHETTVKEVLPAAIKTLKDAGYRLVSVAECTGREPYLKPDAPPLPPSDLTCG